MPPANSETDDRDAAILRRPDFTLPVRVRDELFDVAIAKTEEAITKHAAALTMSTHFGLGAIELFDPEAVGFSSEDWYATYSIIIRYLDQLLTFAFESAPDSVIARWAGNHEGLSAADVIDRVKRMRARMPVLARLWRSKSMSVLPQLAEPDFELAAGPDADEEPYALLSIPATAGGPVYAASTPLEGSRLLVRVTVGDIEYLRWFLGNIVDELTEPASEADSEERGDDASE